MYWADRLEIVVAEMVVSSMLFNSWLMVFWIHYRVDG